MRISLIENFVLTNEVRLNGCPRNVYNVYCTEPYESILLFIGFLKIRRSLCWIISSYQGTRRVWSCCASSLLSFCRISRAEGRRDEVLSAYGPFVSNLRSPVSFHENRNFSPRVSYESRNLLALYSPAFPLRVFPFSHALWTQFFHFERSPLFLDFPVTSRTS